MKTRLNTPPRPKTLARHYAEGKYCDYPAETIFSAINSVEYDYCPTAVPLVIGFKQIFNANFDAWLYLAKHNTPKQLEKFLANPTGYMESRGIRLTVPFDKHAPEIFAAIAEPQILTALRSDDDMAVIDLLHSDNDWTRRHTERYPTHYLEMSYSALADIPMFLDEKMLEKHGFGSDFSVDILLLLRYLAEK